MVTPGPAASPGTGLPEIENDKGSEMPADFVLPEGLTGCFAVVKLWPEIKTAEDECIARLKSAAAALGIECIEVHADGERLDAPGKVIGRKDVDFVIHLHYDTPKLYDAFSFVALWNPLKFYHEWGYARTSRNLISHDDFLSCSSRAADDHVARMVRKTSTHLPAHFNLYHSTPDIVHGPTLGDHKLFYAGINWEALGGGKSRHQEVLKRLDKTGLLRIYGPTIFQGVKVWEGYESYVNEIPFDGISMIHEISKAGIALVLSSPAHKESELMSNRLFESIAAGALIVCDENPFARRFFGDSLLYIDSRCSPEKIQEDITAHMAWAASHPEAALAMIAKAQELFRNRFALIRSLKEIYRGLPARKLELLTRQGLASPNPINVRLNLLMPEYSASVLKAHVASAVAQSYGNFSAALVIDSRLQSRYRQEIEAVLADLPLRIELVELDFYASSIAPDIKPRRKLGEALADLLPSMPGSVEAVVFVAPNETIFSNHLEVLAGSLQRHPQTHCAATAAVLSNGEANVHGVHELLDFGHVNPAGPVGMGRLMLRMASLPDDLEIALPHLDRRALAVLVGDKPIRQELPSTVVIDLRTPFPPPFFDDAQETEVIRAFSPGALTIAMGAGPYPPPQPAGTPLATAAEPLPLVVKMLSPRWHVAQFRALRDHGFRARLRALKAKFSF